MISTLLLALGALLVVVGVLALLGLSIGVPPVPAIVVGVLLLIVGAVIGGRGRTTSRL